MKGALALSILVCAIVLASGCTCTLFNTVIVRDAYCNLDNTFTFTLENTDGSNRSVEYVWTLNDPMADMPLYRGEGAVVLQPHESLTLTFEPDKIAHKDALRGCAMCITLYTDGEEVYRYKEQKSPFDWNYSVQPPVRYVIKPGTMSFLFSTVFERDPNSDHIVTIANSSYTPKGAAPGPKLSQIYLEIGEIGWWTSQIASSPQNGSAPVFVDRDGDSCITEGDYYVVPESFTGQNVRFHSVSGHILLEHTCYTPGSSRPHYGQCQLPSRDNLADDQPNETELQRSMDVNIRPSCHIDAEPALRHT